MVKFKDISPGYFRAKNMLCYVKLEKEISYGENDIANAVMITSGQLKHFEDTDLVENFEENK